MNSPTKKFKIYFGALFLKLKPFFFIIQTNIKNLSIGNLGVLLKLKSD